MSVVIGKVRNLLQICSGQHTLDASLGEFQAHLWSANSRVGPRKSFQRMDVKSTHSVSPGRTTNQGGGGVAHCLHRTEAQATRCGCASSALRRSEFMYNLPLFLEALSLASRHSRSLNHPHSVDVMPPELRSPRCSGSFITTVF